MKNKITKTVSKLLVVNTLLSGGMLGGGIALAEEVRPLTDSTRASVVTPVNLLKSPEGIMEITNFKDWDALVGSKGGVNNTQLGALGRDSNGFFVYDKNKISAAQYVGSNGKLGFQFETNYDGGRAMVRQQVDVIAGETYELRFWASGPNGYSKANIIAKFGSADELITTGMDSFEAPAGGAYKTYQFTAAKTGKADVVLGGYMSYYNILGARSVNTKVADITVKNIDVTPPTVPATNPIYTDANLATGTGEPNSVIIVTDEEGKTFEGPTDSIGAYSIQLPRLVAGTTLLISNRDTAGNIGDSKEVLVRQGELVKPEITPASNLDTIITGQADIKVDVQVKVIKEDFSEKLYTGVTDKDGNYLITIPLLEYKDVVEVTTTATGKRSETAKIVVSDKAVPAAPVVEEINEDTTTIKGTATAGNTVRATYPDGSIHEVVVAKDDTFSFKIETQKFGENFTFVQVKPSGLESPVTTKVVGEGSLIAPTYNELTDQTTIISGTATANANFTIVVKDTAGTIIKMYNGIVDSSGKYSILVTKLEANQIVTMTTTKDGLSSIPLEITVKDVTAPSAPTLKAVSSSDVKIIGTAEAESKVIASVDSVQIGEGLVSSDGKFEITIPKQKEKTVVSVVAEDKAGNVSTKATTVVTASTEFNITTSKYVVGDTKLTGTMGSGVSKVRLFVNGVIKAQAKTTKGNYTVENANKFILSATDKVEIVGVDASYAEVNRISVSVSGTSLTELTAKAYTIGDSTLTGTFGSAISKIRLSVNGEVKAQAIKNNTTGVYTVNNANSFILKSTDKVEMIAVDAQYKEIARTSVVINGTAATSLTVENYTAGDSSLNGTYSEDISKVRLFVNGEVKAQAVTDSASGKYQFNNVDRFILSSSDKVEIVGVSAQYVELARVSVAIAEDISKLTIDGGNTFSIKSKKITGSYGISGHQVRLFVNGEVKAQALKDIENKTFSFDSVKGIAIGDTVEVKLVNKQFTVINIVKLTVVD